MLTCPSCRSGTPETSRFCPSCGEALSSSSRTPTRLAYDPSERRGSPPGVSGPGRAALSGFSDPSSGSFEEGRFIAGTLLAQRYRIVGLLGRGGMGEVYRANDLRLGQSVALKFLPSTLAHDAPLLARFHGEVRIARQVSHPNVCRVYDIGETDGIQFLSMEYVDGEDLASLLRRIGRLPADKAVEISRQLCAGLAAAHDKGVLHRDLKPANVMIDGRGKVLITDFGLAGLAEQLTGAQVRAGTPAYMAPEQLAGKEVSVRSDLYSLGLVLYELFVGKPAFRSGSLAEHVRMHEQGATPTSPSTLVEGFDPVVERVILRCLEKEPRNRPPSALAVSAALPGGDPLAAALAAGEMPSPEMVAAAGEVGSLTPAAAWACLASVIAGTILLAVMVSGRSGARQLSREDPPEVLASKAREMIGGAGYTDPPRDRAYGFYEDEDYLRYVREHDKSVRRWDEVQAGHPAAIVFWYRQSPRYLEPVTFPMLRPQQISRDDPPPIESGMTGVLLDPQSRLIGFYAVPPQVDEPQATSPPPDWKILFTAAGLDASGFKPVTPQWTPPVWSDTREAWEGFLPGRRDLPLRIEAASYRGRPVYFEVVRPWTRPERMQRSSNSGGEVAAQIFLLTLFIGIVIGGAVLARRNLKLGRGDRRGAARIALFIFAVSLLAWIIGGAHVPTFYEAGLFVMAVSWALFSAALVSVVYLALEPSVRRRWPDVLISWSRVLAGRLRDPLVGRDLLVGCLIPIALLFISYGAKLLSVWRGLPQPAPTIGNTAFLGGIRQGAGSIAGSVALSVFVGLTIVFLLFVLRTILRRQWLAGAAFVVIFTIPTMTSADDLLLRIPVAVSLWTLTVIALMRFGVFSVMTLFFCGPLLGTFLLVGDPSAWYAGRAFLPLAVYFALAVYGFHTALAGQPLFRERPAA